MTIPVEDNGRRAARVFDALGPAYEKAFAHAEAHRRSLDWLLGRLAPGSRVLDVGSGTGRPTAATLVAAGHDVLGVDVSPVMVELAARQVPGARFQCADVRGLSLDEGSLDAVCVYFSLLQLDRAEQTELIGRFARALAPGGSLVLATVPLDVAGVDAVFMGQPVRVTSFDGEALVEVVRDAGLTVLAEENTLFTPDHPEAVPEPHLFLYCAR
ncbi:class I SAM-dependent methyltransferase [Streptomyces sp. NBC_01275]|uniref:class I SAM-dependent methyltransferase n=1 Tax=Streptomyces sp. NBC_01275 TaxID=2903807 RepID=UPI002255D859|nr:class I SAM-dependent methyltransferase [Streptomyces sp. NBC_01275]MCX4767169.1 class I SAM-dependent methyltransferase [Streptomyces sp. NBC_01275]